jgi:hypothetical protein
MVVKGKTYLKFLLIYSFFDFRYECLVLGQQEFAVEYRDKLYFLLDEEAREKFMRFIYFNFYISNNHICFYF